MDILKFIRAGVILECCDRYLVVQGRLSDKWSFPKGHRELNETPIQTATRELKEETGIVLKNPENYDKLITYYNSDYVYFHYTLTDIIIPPIINDKEEVKDVKWLHVDELKQYKYDKNCTLKLYLKNLNKV